MSSLSREDLLRDNKELRDIIRQLLDINDRDSHAAGLQLREAQEQLRKERQQWQNEKRIMANMFAVRDEEAAELVLDGIKKECKIRELVKAMNGIKEQFDQVCEQADDLNEEAQAGHDEVVRLERQLGRMENMRIGMRYLKDQNEIKQEKINRLTALLHQREDGVPTDPIPSTSSD